MSVTIVLFFFHGFMLSTSCHLPHLPTFQWENVLNFSQLLCKVRIAWIVLANLLLNLLNLLWDGIFLPICFSNESKISIAEHTSLVLLLCISAGSPLFPMPVACFALFFILTINIRMHEVWGVIISFLQVVSFLQVTKVYLSVKLRFSSQLWLPTKPHHLFVVL